MMGASRQLALQNGSASNLRTRPRPSTRGAPRCVRGLHGQPVALCLARTKGPLVFALRKYDFLVLFPINPLTLARYRAAFTPSRAKDDPSAAALQLALRRTPRDSAAAAPSAKPHHACPRTARRTSSSRGRGYGAHDHRLTRTLKNYFPQVLQWVAGQRYPHFLRLSAPLAHPQSGPTRAPHHPGALLPRPPRALGRRDHTAPPRPQGRHAVDHR